MAEKQEVRHRISGSQQNTMDNAQDNDEWAPAPYPVTKAPYHATPAPVVTQGRLPYATARPVFSSTPDDALEQHRREGVTQVKILSFISYIFAFIALTNVIDLVYMDFSKAKTHEIVFTVLKAIVGMFGVIVLSTKEFSAVKAYAVTYLLVYGCYVGFFIHNAFKYRREITAHLCGAERYLTTDPVEYSKCLDRAWSALMWKALYMTTFTIFGYLVTWDYVRKMIKLSSSDEDSEKATTNVL
eukprot:GEMP01057798.1.p1 GENE.GEMP01057798.1~~GEMP01057798.1.p1  ORF type:complete len:242 (+),score=57.49 GEMP01057798.1:95-820(+)